MRPIPMLDIWTEDHPVIVKYNKTGSKNADLTSIFKDNFNFLDSKDNFEIRITDIVAIIVNRFWNSNKYIGLNRLIKNKWCIKDAHIQLILNDFDIKLKLEDIAKNQTPN